MKKAMSFMLLTGMMLTVSACVVREERPVAVQQRPDIQARIDNQQKRIDQGVDAGRVSGDDADVLQDNLNHISDEYNTDKDEGKLTPGEVYKLEKMLDRNSKMIYDARHNPVSRVY